MELQETFKVKGVAFRFHVLEEPWSGWSGGKRLRCFVTDFDAPKHVSAKEAFDEARIRIVAALIRTHSYLEISVTQLDISFRCDGERINLDTFSEVIKTALNAK